MLLAKNLTHTGFTDLNILSIDLSYRDSGWCIMKCDLKKKEYSFSFGSIKNPPIEMGFEGLRKASQHMTMLRDMIEGLHEEMNICLIEMPAYTQSAKAAISVGMLWGMVSTLGFRPVFISPQQLKLWSESKKGDGKEEVKKKVIDRVNLGSYQSNDNVVDAVGISLMFSDMISISRHEH